MCMPNVCQRPRQLAYKANRKMFICAKKIYHTRIYSKPSSKLPSIIIIIVVGICANTSRTPKSLPKRPTEALRPHHTGLISSKRAINPFPIHRRRAPPHELVKCVHLLAYMHSVPRSFFACIVRRASGSRLHVFVCAARTAYVALARLHCTHRLNGIYLMRLCLCIPAFPHARDCLFYIMLFVCVCVCPGALYTRRRLFLFCLFSFAFAWLGGAAIRSIAAVSKCVCNVKVMTNAVFGAARARSLPLRIVCQYVGMFPRSPAKASQSGLCQSRAMCKRVVCMLFSICSSMHWLFHTAWHNNDNDDGPSYGLRRTLRQAQCFARNLAQRDQLSRFVAGHLNESRR